MNNSFNENSLFFECIINSLNENKSFVKYINHLLNENNSFVEHINNSLNQNNFDAYGDQHYDNLIICDKIFSWFEYNNLKTNASKCHSSYHLTNKLRQTLTDLSLKLVIAKSY